MTDPNMPGVLTELGPIKADTKKVAYEVVKAAAEAGHQLYFVWGTGDTGDHKAGIALDFMVYDKGEGENHPGPERPEVGRWVRDYLWANRERLGVRYLIFSHQIISRTGTPPNVELPYTAIVNGKRDPHTNHVHCSRFADAPKYQPPRKPAPSIGDEVPLQVNGDVAFATKLALGPNRKTIPLVDKDSPSILSEDHTGDGALRVHAGVNVSFSGLTGDHKVFGCWVLFDDNGKRVGMVKGTQRTGSAGDHTLDVVWPFTLGRNRRLRFEAWTNQPSGVAVTLARSSVHYWKA